MIQLVPSILSADWARLGEQARQAEAAGANGLQVDVMDGRFVPNITFGPGVVRALRPLVGLPLQAHLMVVEPERHLEAFAQAGADMLIVHQETCPHLDRTLRTIRSLRVQAGVTLNPATPAAALEEVLHLVDLVQVMTVNPGWGGQDLIVEQLEKVRRLRRMLDERGLVHVPVAVDGGVDPTTAPRVVEAGATVLIAGSSVYNERGSVAENIAALRESVEGDRHFRALSARHG